MYSSRAVSWALSWDPRREDLALELKARQKLRLAAGQERAELSSAAREASVLEPMAVGGESFGSETREFRIQSGERSPSTSADAEPVAAFAEESPSRFEPVGRDANLEEAQLAHEERLESMLPELLSKSRAERALAPIRSDRAGFGPLPGPARTSPAGRRKGLGAAGFRAAFCRHLIEAPWSLGAERRRLRKARQRPQLLAQTRSRRSGVLALCPPFQAKSRRYALGLPSCEEPLVSHIETSAPRQRSTGEGLRGEGLRGGAEALAIEGAESRILELRPVEREEPSIRTEPKGASKHRPSALGGIAFLAGVLLIGMLRAAFWIGLF